MLHRTRYNSVLMCGVAALAISATAGVAHADDKRDFNIAPQPLATALMEFGAQSGVAVVAPGPLTVAKTTKGVSAQLEPEMALQAMLSGTGLTYRREGELFAIVRAGEGGSDPQSGSAAGDGADGTVEALIVTAQKREEDIQDVPIAISAFTQEDLTRSQVAGGPDLMTQVPNFTFTKTNFSGYSIQIRGIGTQAISATTDAAVAVALNNTPFIRNRFFEQEFYDLQRVEVLRGPQGTLYGRNATAGVVNIISQKPKFGYEARLSADVSNYSSTRVEGMVNVPLVEEKVALRIAGAWTKRDGYDTNAITGNQIDGRNLWSTRLSLRFAPTDALDVNLIWEHFQEDDDRLRSGKQLCKRSLPATIGGVPVDYSNGLPAGSVNGATFSQYFSQGCEAASLYSPDSFEVPVGERLPYYGALHGVGLPSPAGWGYDPFSNTSQSHDLRTIESTVDPEYRANSDLVEIQAQLDLPGSLTLASETSFQVDELFSMEDYNRFNTRPGVFLGGSNFANAQQLLDGGLVDENGVFCDPQIGCANRLVVVDVSTARSRQFSQEFRLSSDYDGPLNFSLGANFLRYDTEDKYYVFANSITLTTAILSKYGRSFAPLYDYPDYVPNVYDNSQCLMEGSRAPRLNGAEDIYHCIYIDPNPIGSLNDRGHNYFLSKNPYKLVSYAAFGELYYDITERLKLTAGLRWTVDEKEAPRIPSWLFAANSVGYPVAETLRQTWREPTGRLTLDWKPDLSFTDETLLYASYAHGYKAGGANPPSMGVVMRNAENFASYPPEFYALAAQRAAASPRTFEPEFVNAFEVGAKNTLFGGAVTLNASAFYYDYTGYQISQIVDRAALNLNFDAKIWGAELEADWRPLENLRFGFKGGYEKTKMADGSRAIDTMDRTAGNPDWFVTGPFPTFASNCVLPTYLAVAPDGSMGMQAGTFGGNLGPCETAYVLGQDPGQYWTYPEYPGFLAKDHPEINGGAGFFKDLSGNELPNAPHFTATLTADYTVALPHDWLATLHTDLYYQSEAWTRVFNTPGYDKLKAYNNINVAAILTNEDAGWTAMAYVKNVLDHDAITGAFLNSDDTGLTTNLFLNEPRLYGLRVTKEWNGGPWWTGANANHVGPYPLTIEIGGQVQRHDAPSETFVAPAMQGLPADLNTQAAVQGRDLDRGDGRLLRVTWRPTGSNFEVSAGLRRNRVNGDMARLHAQHEVTAQICAFPAPFDAFCDPTNPFYNPVALDFTAQSWSDTAARTAERQTIGDLEVGYRLGATPFVSRSRMAAGLRYAAFESNAVFDAAARDGWVVEPGWIAGLEVHDYSAGLEANRRFKGVGPAATWDAAATLWGGEAEGRLDVEWSMTAGVLFGEQETSIWGQSVARLGHTANGGDGFSWPTQTVGEPTVYDLDRESSKSVSAPLVDLSLGLSYEIQRVKIGAGYRWERYFDVLDVGFDEHEAGDRTIDGPYFKLSVGFGG